MKDLREFLSKHCEHSKPNHVERRSISHGRLMELLDDATWAASYRQPAIPIDPFELMALIAFIADGQTYRPGSTITRAWPIYRGDNKADHR